VEGSNLLHHSLSCAQKIQEDAASERCAIFTLPRRRRTANSHYFITRSPVVLSPDESPASASTSISDRSSG
jgi:hypothetical protein